MNGVMMIECIFYENGRILGKLTSLCRSSVVEFHDTNMMLGVGVEMRGIALIVGRNGCPK